MADAATAALSTVGLIFGGCCSNVFALEAIIKRESDSGLLITFFQFLLTTAFAYTSQFSPSISDGLLRRRNVPLRKWAFIASMFFSINMLNNWAFAFSISVPVHIILRSFGSVTTMLAGAIRGKRYSMLQVVSVMILTAGVLVSAWADAESKGKDLSTHSTESTSTSSLTAGLSILLLAQCLSAYMGIYVQDTYAEYSDTNNWKENLFYSHFLSLPMFLPLAPTLKRQYDRLVATPALGNIFSTDAFALDESGKQNIDATYSLALLQTALNAVGQTPIGIALLAANALTQLACISGVNLLSASASAVTVTIVLNIRKLVSFVFSTLLFGHRLGAAMVVGSALVFGSGALYGYETSWRIPRHKRGGVARERREVKDDGRRGNGGMKKRD